MKKDNKKPPINLPSDTAIPNPNQIQLTLPSGITINLSSDDYKLEYLIQQALGIYEYFNKKGEKKKPDSV